MNGLAPFTDCRDRGHAWVLPGEYRKLTGRGSSVVGFAIDDGVLTRTLLCLRCETDRLELLTRRGERVRMRYHYADGYLIKGAGRHSREEYRTIAVKAALKAMGQRRRKAA